jgi:hypothetical protein
MKSEVMQEISHIEGDETLPFTIHDILENVQKLKGGTSPGKDKISNEHIKYASSKIVFFICCLFNQMLIHGYVPSKLMDTLVVPIVKDKKGILTDKNNYRPIAITSTLSKLLESCLLTKYKLFLSTNSHQFGYKKGHSTDMSIFVLKETIDYYHSLSSPVYVCYLDASKAFDRLNHWHLYKKLLDRRTPKVLVKLLMNWYANQKLSVFWNGSESEHFKVSNGVRQGGVLSPHLFNVYMEELSENLSESSIGCHMKSTCLNHMFFADDSILMAPTIESLQSLIDICVDYAKRFDILYNDTKSCCSVFLPKHLKDMNIPSVNMESKVLKWVSTKTYLGVIICADRKDTDDMSRQMKAIYRQGNSIIRKFFSCTDNVKICLFKTYCYNMYCIPLWFYTTHDAISDVKVAYNNIFRQFFNLSRRCSVSFEFLKRGINSFEIVQRKSIFSLYSRLYNCENNLINTLVRSPFFTYRSRQHDLWKDTLFKL